MKYSSQYYKTINVKNLGGQYPPDLKKYKHNMDITAGC